MGTHRTRRGLVLEQMNRLCGALFVLPLALVFVNGEEKESTGIPAPGGHVNCITADNKMQLMCLAGESGVIINGVCNLVFALHLFPSNFQNISIHFFFL